jgi:hypothetical protein
MVRFLPEINDSYATTLPGAGYIPKIPEDTGL